MYWTKENEKQVSHKYYRLHEDRRRFELGLRFYRSSFSYLSVDRKTDINMQILKRAHNLLLRKTSICPPYWNANSKTLEPSLLLLKLLIEWQWKPAIAWRDKTAARSCMGEKRETGLTCDQATFFFGAENKKSPDRRLDGASLPRKRSFIYLFIYLFHALLDKIKTEWNIQTW